MAAVFFTQEVWSTESIITSAQLLTVCSLNDHISNLFIQFYNKHSKEADVMTAASLLRRDRMKELNYCLCHFFETLDE